MPQAPASLRPRFNLKREAAPVATRRRDPLQLVYGLVSISNEKPPRLPQQCNVSALRLRRVSISNEKPPRLPPRVFASTCQQRFCFNLKREAAPVATGGCLAPLLERRDRCVCEADGFFPFKVQNHDPLY